MDDGTDSAGGGADTAESGSSGTPVGDDSGDESEDESEPDAEPEAEPEPEPVARTFTVRNDAEAPLLIDAYPGFRISQDDVTFSRWSCAPECGVCGAGECGCARDSVSEIMPGETLELTWSGEYWEEQDGCEDRCASLRTAAPGSYTLSLDYGFESVDQGGCIGENISGDVRTASIEFEHPAQDGIELVLPPV